MRAARYATTVTAVGAHVHELLGGGRLILFGEGAPSELHDICVLHSPETRTCGVRPGDVVQLGADRLTVTDVGHLANPNLEALGHVTLRLEQTAEAALPGEIVVSGALPGHVESGMPIRIEGAADA